MYKDFLKKKNWHPFPFKTEVEQNPNNLWPESLKSYFDIYLTNM